MDLYLIVCEVRVSPIAEGFFGRTRPQNLKFVTSFKPGTQTQYAWLLKMKLENVALENGSGWGVMARNLCSLPGTKF